jgi:hypothetical protein
LILKHCEIDPSISSKALSKIIGISYNSVNNKRKRPAFRLALQKLQETTDYHLDKAAHKAAMKLIEMIDHPNPAIALAAVKIALTRHLDKMPDISDRVYAYKTTIDVDGKLLQEIVKEELKSSIIDVESEET